MNAFHLLINLHTSLSSSMIFFGLRGSRILSAHSDISFSWLLLALASLLFLHSASLHCFNSLFSYTLLMLLSSFFMFIITRKSECHLTQFQYLTSGCRCRIVVQAAGSALNFFRSIVRQIWIPHSHQKC